MSWHSCPGTSCLCSVLSWWSERCLTLEAILYSGHFGGATLLCCNPGRLGEAGHVLVHLERRVIRVSCVVLWKLFVLMWTKQEPRVEGRQLWGSPPAPSRSGWVGFSRLAWGARGEQVWNHPRKLQWMCWLQREAEGIALEIGKIEDKQPKHFSRWQPAKGALLDFGSQLFCVEVWKIFCEDCFLFAMQLNSVLV